MVMVTSVDCTGHVDGCHVVLIVIGTGCHVVVEVIGNDCPGSG